MRQEQFEILGWIPNIVHHLSDVYYTGSSKEADAKNSGGPADPGRCSFDKYSNVDKDSEKENNNNNNNNSGSGGPTEPGRRSYYENSTTKIKKTTTTTTTAGAQPIKVEIHLKRNMKKKNNNNVA